jgi:hypothetical protein
MNKREFDIRIYSENRYWYVELEITRESKRLDKVTGKSLISYQQEELFSFGGESLYALKSSVCANSDLILKALSDHGFYVCCEVAFVPGHLARITPFMDTGKYLSIGGDLAGLTGLDETFNSEMEIFALIRVLSKTLHYGRSYFKVDR